MAVYAIGDIQGCFDELQRLLDHIKFDASRDQLWFCGDLVNRGPKSLESLRFIRALGDCAITVLGNHDLHLLAVGLVNAESRPRDTFASILKAPDKDELLHWLRHRPLLHHDDVLGYTMVHAGMAPQWDLPLARSCAKELEQVLRSDSYHDFLSHMYGNQPEQWSEKLEKQQRLRVITNYFTRIRYCNLEGRMELDSKGSPGQQPDRYFPWFEHPARKNKDLNIVFGHWSTLGKRNDPGVFPLDTGCVWGGQLSALRLDGKATWFHLDCPEALNPRNE